MDRIKNKIPSNITIMEFYFPAGKYLGNSYAQRNYVSSNYTHVLRDALDRKVNLLVQLISEKDGHYNLGCNPDVSSDMLAIKDDVGLVTVGELNKSLPYMYGEAVRPKKDFDFVYEPGELEYPLFAPPKMSVPNKDYMIGLYASTLVKDDGELQIGIGSLGDSLVYSLIKRHKDNQKYQEYLNKFQVTRKFSEEISHLGETSAFNKGVFGATEMIVDGFMELYKNDILKKKTYDHIGLQRLLNEGKIKERFDSNILDVLLENKVISHKITEMDFNFLVHFGIFKDGLNYKNGTIYLNDKDFVNPLLSELHDLEEVKKKCLGTELKNGHILHGGFFLGPKNFYNWLHGLSDEERRLIVMKSVRKINHLYGHEELDRLHRKNARFINTCMMMTLSGAAVSDGLADGRVVSGVGGQFNFVSQAQALPDGTFHSMLKKYQNQEW
jgi:hypothetical protein